MRDCFYVAPLELFDLLVLPYLNGGVILNG